MKNLTIEINKVEKAIFNTIRTEQKRSFNKGYKQTSMSISQACKYVCIESPIEYFERDEANNFIKVTSVPKLEFIATLKNFGIDIIPTFTSDEVYKVFKMYGKFTRNLKGVESPVLEFNMNNIVSAYQNQARTIASNLKAQAKNNAKK
jgi:hypothetical protein